MWLRLGFRAQSAPHHHNQDAADWTERRQDLPRRADRPAGQANTSREKSLEGSVCRARKGA